MTDDTKPYLARNPGDAITAKDWDDMQVMIKGDMTQRIDAAVQDLRQTGVDHAGDSTRFSGRTDHDWLTQLDGRYAPKVHDHEGAAVYRRYIKQFRHDPPYDKIMIKHGLGRYPLVVASRLLPVTTAAGYEDCKLFFYYGNADADQFGLWARAYRDQVPLGLPIDPLLTELAVAYTDQTSIQDLVNDLGDALAKDPNDRVKFCHSPWIDECCERNRTVGDLRRNGQFDDLYLAIRPRQCVVGVDPAPAAGQAPVHVDVTHVNYTTLLVEADSFEQDAKGNFLPLDLMLLLRS